MKYDYFYKTYFTSDKPFYVNIYWVMSQLSYFVFCSVNTQ